VCKMPLITTFPSLDDPNPFYAIYPELTLDGRNPPNKPFDNGEGFYIKYGNISM